MNTVFFIRKHLPAISAAICAALLLTGILMGHHTMIMSYAIVVCLSCIGIG